MSKHPLISVIVPVYNVEQYLEQCLTSIASQSYTQLEVVVVDDGSTDGSPGICDRWAERDKRFTVIHKPNGGVSDARNTGLRAATGRLLTMVDGDDWLQADAIELMYNLLINTDSDVAVFYWREVFPHTVPDIQHPTPLSSWHRYDSRQTLRRIFYQKGFLTHSPWGRLYKSRLFDGLQYQHGIIYEDLAIAYDLYKRCSSVVVSDCKCYNYMQRNTSFMGDFKPQRLDVLDVVDRLETRIAKQEPQLLPAVRSRRLSAHFNILLLCPASPEYDDVRDRCWNVIKQLRVRCFFDPHIRLKNRLGIMASFLGRKTFIKLFSKGAK